MTATLAQHRSNTFKDLRWQQVVCSIPVVADVMLTVLTPLKNGLKLWWVIKIPPVKVEVRLRILGVFVSSCQNVKRTNQPQTQCVFQCTYID